MAYNYSIPFYAFKLHLQSGGFLTVPLNDQEAIRIGQPLHLLSDLYAELLQKKILNKGSFQKILDEYREGNFYKGAIKVEFPAAKDRISYPAFHLEFEYFFNTQADGIWGIIPVLGLENFAPTQEKLQKRLEEAVRLEFARKKRFLAVQHLVTAIWYDIIELNQQTIDLQFPGPKELEEITEQKQERFLPLVAQELNINKQIVFGRKEELELLARALKGKFNRNILLVGPSGVGKTALVWEISRQQKRRRIKGQIWETTASIMIKELMRETGWQDNLSYLCKELSGTNDILFVRNLMELFEVGQYEGNTVSIADYLRTFISKGEVTVLSECSEEELAQIELRSPNYLSFFQVIRLEEPQKELEDIILKKVQDTASNRNVEIAENAIREVIRLNKRFTPYSGMPGKPIRFLESILINKRSQEINVTPKISRSEVIQHFCQESGMPLFMVDPSIPMNVKNIKDQFNSNVYGQEEAVDGLVNLLASVKTGLTKIGKPIASLLFVGPTGVGKTELAKVLAEFMFGSRERLVRFDMSEFSNPNAVMRLIGTDFFSDGLLTSAIRREPFSVLLFDEIEKADPIFFDLLLQVLSEGRLTDSQGKLVNFCSTIIIMTSNIGASRLMNNRIGWNPEEVNNEINDYFLVAVQKYFRPELFNRIDQVVAFSPLASSVVRFVVEREIGLLREREGIRFRSMDLDIKEVVFDHLAKFGYSHLYGARQLQRIIREKLIIPLAKALNVQEYDDRLMVTINILDEQIHISIEADPLGLELLIEELDKINYADHASDLRRQIFALQEGHFYVRLLSEFDILERKKKKTKAKFWKNQLQVEKYTHFIEIKSKLEKLIEQIEEYELSLSLACLNISNYQPALVDKLQEWESNLFDLKIEMYSRLESKSNTCHFAIYGTELKQIVDQYVDIFLEKEFEFSAHSVWFREKLYNEEIEVETGAGKASIKAKGEQYFKTIFAPKRKGAYQPKERGDLLYGIEFVVTGTCAFLYLQEEEGLQRWKSINNQDRFYVLKASNEVFSTPEKIHRQEFYKRQSPRRIVDDSIFRDSLNKINRELSPSDWVKFIISLLDEHFRNNLNAEVL